MALDQETTIQQQELLATYRQTLAHLLEQAAQYGGEVFAPPQTANGIAEARQQICRIKVILRENGVQVNDDLNDEVPPHIEPVPLPRAGGDIVSGDKVVGDKVMGDKRTINTEGGDYAEGNIDKRQGAFVEGGTVIGNVIGQQSNNYYQAPVIPLDRQQQRNRRAMLSKVKTIWIDGLLEQSLAKELRIVLDLTEEPNAVDLPLNALVQELNRPPRELPAGTPIIDVFDQMGGALLILGAPGAGKTTILLELARDLIARAEQDEGHPIPVVFSLSSWANKRQPLKDWLVEELNTKYDVPRKLAQGWIATDVVLPLLDGLDEVTVEYRGDCVEAINTYRQEHGLLPLTVCSRVADYSGLDTKLRLQGAIVVQPLTKQQALDYLEHAGQKLTGVRAALRDDAVMGEMLDTPLMLSVVALAYAGKSVAEVQAAGTPDERRHLFDAYIEAMFHRRGVTAWYTPQQTGHALSWLAGQMVEQKQTVFYIEWMQPNWLHRWGRQWFAIRVGLLSALVGGLVCALGVGLLFGPVGALGVGLLGGLVGGLVGALSSYPAEIRPVETLRWSWIAAGGGRRSSLVLALTFGLVGLLGVGLLFGLGVGLLFGLGVGLVGWVLGWLVGEVTEAQITKRTIIDSRQFRRLVWHILAGGLFFGLIGGLGGGLGGLFFGLIGGLGGGLGGALLFVLSTRDIPTQTVDSKSMRRAAWAALVSGLLFGLGSGLLFGLDGGLIAGLRGGLGVGLLGITFGWLGSWLSGGPRTQQATLQNKALRRFARNALSGGLVGGLGGGLIFGLGGGLGGGLIFGLGGGLIFGPLGGLLGGLLSGLIEGDITTRTITNEGIRRSIRSAVVGGLVGGLVSGLGIGLVFGLLGGVSVARSNGQPVLFSGLGGALLSGLLGGLVFGLLYGGATVLQHYTLRLVLSGNGSLPLRLVPFLDYCTDRIFLRKVGGGYIFVHRLLMEHFASLHKDA